MEINGFRKEIEHIDILICTPLKFLKVAKRAQENFNFLEFLVFDEADRYFEFVIILIFYKNIYIYIYIYKKKNNNNNKKNLQKQMKKILEHFQNLTNVNYLLFSATIQHPVEELVK